MLELSHRFATAAALVAIVAGVTACGSGQAADPGFAGHWTSTQWGEHYIMVEDGTVKIIYDHDNGRVLGTLDGSTVTGWWTETPSRTPPRDAGDVTFILIDIDGSPAIDGVWRYGSDTPLRENWDLTWVGTDIPPDVAAQFADGAAFVSHP